MIAMFRIGTCVALVVVVVAAADRFLNRLIARWNIAINSDSALVLLFSFYIKAIIVAYVNLSKERKRKKSSSHSSSRSPYNEFKLKLYIVYNIQTKLILFTR